MSEQPERNRRRKVIGTVTSDRMNRTITVRVDRALLHPRFKKYLRRSTKYKIHDEKNEAHIGDKVEFVECRPLSRTKSHRLVRIIGHSEEARAPDLPVEEQEAEA